MKRPVEYLLYQGEREVIRHWPQLIMLFSLFPSAINLDLLHKFCKLVTGHVLKT